MKKLFLTIMTIVGIGASAMAASNSNRYFTKGYRADVRISATATNNYHFTSSHGYALGYGFYIGGGAGFGAEWVDGGLTSDPHFTPSLFLDAKWSVLNRRISPYVDVKAVQYIDLTAGSTNYGITPSLGIDCGHFSVGVGYELRGNRSALQLGLGLNF